MGHGGQELGLGPRGEFRLGLGLVEMTRDEPQFELVHNDLGQRLKAALLGVGEAFAWLGVNHAEGAELVAALQAERRASVEADMGRAGHQRVVGEAIVFGSVRHHHDVLAADGMVAE